MKPKRVNIAVTSEELQAIMQMVQKSLEAFQFGRQYGLISDQQIRARRRFRDRIRKVLEEEFPEG